LNSCHNEVLSIFVFLDSFICNENILKSLFRANVNISTSEQLVKIN
jgi:hypothetical protein